MTRHRNGRQVVWLPLVSRTEPAQRAEYIRQKTANEKEASNEIRKNQTHLRRSPKAKKDMSARYADTFTRAMNSPTILCARCANTAQPILNR